MYICISCTWVPKSFKIFENWIQQCVNQVVFIPIMQSWFNFWKATDASQYISRLKMKKTNLSKRWSETFNKIPHLIFMIKTLSKLARKPFQPDRKAPVLTLFVVQSLSHVWLCNPMNCGTPDFSVLTISRSLLKLMSIESTMPSNHLILCRLLLLLPTT